MPTDLTSAFSGWQTTSNQGSFEESMNALEEIVSLLDAGELTLEESLSCFELGVRLSNRCQLLLEQAELRVEMVQRQLEATPHAEPPF